MIRNNVDLPQPEGPINETNSRSPISSSIPSSAVVVPKRFETPLISTTLIVASAGDSSNQVLRRAAHDQLLGDDDDQEERDSECGGDQVRRPQSTRLRRVVLAEVDDLGAEPVWDRRRELADQRADDACSRADLQSRKDVGQRRGKAELPENAPITGRITSHQ